MKPTTKKWFAIAALVCGSAAACASPCDDLKEQCSSCEDSTTKTACETIVNGDNGDSWLARSSFWGPAVDRFGLKVVEGPVAVFKILSVFLLISVFWALFDQHSSSWIFQAGQMDLWLWGDGRESFLGIPNTLLDKNQVPALNPLMVGPWMDAGRIYHDGYRTAHAWACWDAVRAFAPGAESLKQIDQREADLVRRHPEFF